MQKPGIETLIFHANAPAYLARERTSPLPSSTLAAYSGPDDSIALKEQDAAVQLRKHGFQHGHPGADGHHWRQCGGKRPLTPNSARRLRRPADLKEAVAAQTEFMQAQQLQSVSLAEEQRTQKGNEPFYDDYGYQIPGGLFHSMDLQWAGKHRAVLPDTHLCVWIQNVRGGFRGISAQRPPPNISIGNQVFHQQNARTRQTRRRGQRTAKASDMGLFLESCLITD